MPQLQALTFPGFPILLVSISVTFHLPHVNWAVPILVLFPLWGHLFYYSQPIEVTPIEVMEPVKEPDPQESQPPAVPEVAPTSTSTSPLPITETVTAEELEVLRQFRASSTRSSSPTKKAKTDQG